MSPHERWVKEPCLSYCLGAAMTSNAEPTTDSAASIRERGAVGAVLLTVRAAGSQVVAFLGTLVLAHELSPRDFGLVAFGTTVVLIGEFFADGGLGAALIRQPRHPTAAELQSLLGLQLTLGVLLAGAITVVGLQSGTAGGVAAVMACSLPLLALRAPHAIALERDLRYRPIASIDFTESVAYYGWAIATVWAGWGVWGLASAAIVRASIGSVLMTRASPLGVLTPRLDRAPLRAMIGFGIRFQAVGLAALARTQGVNLAILALGGAPLLGYWSLANRLLQVPFWLFQSLWRVSYPTMARLRAFGEDTGRVVVRLARVTALASGAILAPLAASAHSAIPALFGSAWTSAADPIPWACAGLMASGPISVATAGYLYSEHDPQTPLTATIVNGVVWISVTVLLLGPLGITAAGVGWMAASWAEAGVFTRALRRRAHVRVERVIAVPVLIGFASALVAYGISRTLTGQIVSACITASVALAIFGSLNLLFNRDDVLAVARRVRLLRTAQAV
jgi:O-antigen/teichoic acid export membrane protein